MFVFLEIAAIASYALVGFGCEGEELEAAFKYLVLGTVGSAFILLGVTIMYSLSGHLNMAEVSKALARTEPGNAAVMLAAASLLGGLALRAAMVPCSRLAAGRPPVGPRRRSRPCSREC